VFAAPLPWREDMAAPNPKYSSFYFESTPSNELALTNAFTNGHAFKKARFIEYDKHNPLSPRRQTLDGVVMLGQTMTHQTLMSILPPGVAIFKTPPYDPSTGDAWTHEKMYEFARRGDQRSGSSASTSSSARPVPRTMRTLGSSSRSASRQSRVSARTLTR